MAYSKWDYQRMLDILRRVSGETVLDVGCGVGEFELLIIGAGYDVTAIDRNIGNMKPLPIEIHEMDIKSLDFTNNAFDTVIAMEVLEHSPESDNGKMVSELRRVAGEKLLITVPFYEQPPLYKGHKQSFGWEKIQELFPDAETWLIPRGNGLPWIGIME